jgi:hypothetical protein
MLSKKTKLIILGGLALFCAVFYFFLLQQSRLPVAHDTGSYLEQQYVYFNEVAQHHAIPFWFPFTKQGYVTNYYWPVQVMVLAPVAYVIALIAKGLNYLYVFYAGIWFDEMIFLLGIVLLGSLYYKRWESLLFVGITAAASTVWYSQIFWGFHLFYAIPLTLFCWHRFLEEKKAVYLAGAMLGFFTGFIGNCIYPNIFVLFVLLVYGGCSFYWKENRSGWLDALKAWRWPQWAMLGGLCALMGLALYSIKFGGEHVMYVREGRGAGGTVGLDVFLQYGGAINIAKYLAFFDRSDVRFLTCDVSLYAGFLMPFLALAGLVFSRERSRWPVVITAVVVMLFSSGILVSQLFYYVFPGGNIFRHIGLTSPIARMFCILLAGFGADVLFRYLDEGKRKVVVFWGVFAVMMVFLCRGFLVHGQQDPFRLLVPVERVVVDVLRYVLLAVGIVVGLGAWRRYKWAHVALTVLLLSVAALELSVYKYAKTVSTMPRVPPAAIGLFDPLAYPFPMTRKLSTVEHGAESQRIQALWPLLVNRRCAEVCDSVYDTVESLLYTDTLQSVFRSDVILDTANDFISAGVRSAPQVQKDVYVRYAGVTADKVMVFSQLNHAPDIKALEGIFARPGFNPDSVWTTTDQVNRLGSSLNADVVRAVGDDVSASVGKSVPAKVVARKFSFNEVVFDVDIDGLAGQPYFLYFADAYHPFWKAYVNDQEVPVLRANIAYKLIVIPSGHSQARFVFGHPFYVISTAAWLLLCLGVMALLGCLVWREAGKGRG